MRQETPAVRRLFLYAAVTLTGAAVMMVELLGTRIIGPFFGVSLVVWSSLLSVALLALAAGYAAGGRLADRGAPFGLPQAVFCAGAWIGLLIVFDAPVQLWADRFGLRAGALISALVLFFPPLMCLGMAGPFVVRALARRLEAVGRVAGNVFAVSTVGSVAGTLLLGFFLLPAFGLRTVLLATSLVLLALSAPLAAWGEGGSRRRGWRWAAAAAATAVVVVALARWDARPRAADHVVLFERDSPYGWVRVVDQPARGIRWLLADASTIGAASLADGRSLLAYQQIVALTPAFHPAPRRALLIGLGAGHLLRAFDARGMVSDAIEIDPAVVEAARDFFDLRVSGRLIVGDARYQVRRLEGPYDLIVHDCFTGGAEPIHMLSREMLLELERLLAPGGVLVLNVVGFTVERDAKPVAAVARTLDSVFPHRRSFVSAPQAAFNDFVFVVSDRPLVLRDGALPPAAAAWLRGHERGVSGAGGVLITDDYNPLESLQRAKAEHYRRLLIERVGVAMLFR
ncbi:MAG: spermidine synthase [Gammaproteobacteria bacterium]|nr:MAG: spermidine synthase [Gammaproteobacteria bacterium]